MWDGVWVSWYTIPTKKSITPSMERQYTYNLMLYSVGWLFKALLSSFACVLVNNEVWKSITKPNKDNCKQVRFTAPSCITNYNCILLHVRASSLETHWPIQAVLYGKQFRPLVWGTSNKLVTQGLQPWASKVICGSTKQVDRCKFHLHRMFGLRVKNL